MLILIDPREGSNKFLKAFEGESRQVMLDGGDFAFTGNGPDDSILLVGIEHKKIADLVACIQNNRFLGTQLPQMAKLYDVMFLMIEGRYQCDRNSGRLIQSYGRGTGFSFGISYKAFDNFLTAVQTFSSFMGKPCIVKQSSGPRESEQLIRNLYDYYQKPWDEHKLFGQPDFTKLQKISKDLELLRVEPGDEGYPQKVLRQSLLQIRGISWRMAGLITKHFQTMEGALAASQKDWEALDGIGKTLAKRAYEALHGHPDPTIKSRKKSQGGQS